MHGMYIKIKKVKWSHYRPSVAQSVGRDIALLFHDRGTRRGWVVNSTPRPHFTAGKDPVPILQETGLAPGPVCTDGKSRPHRDSIPDRPARSSVAIPTQLPGPHIKIIYFYIPYALSNLSRNLVTQFPKLKKKTLYFAILETDIYIINIQISFS